jgi:hypothetical protein
MLGVIAFFLDILTPKFSLNISYKPSLSSGLRKSYLSSISLTKLKNSDLVIFSINIPISSVPLDLPNNMAT